MNRSNRQMIFRAFSLMGSWSQEYFWREVQLRGAVLSESTRARLTVGLHRAARNRDRLNRFIERTGREI